MTQPPEYNDAAPPPPPQPVPPRPERIPVSMPATSPRVTYTILGITIAVYLLQMVSQFALGGDLPVAIGAKVNDAIRAGQLWRFFTPMLLHGSIMHIGFNMHDRTVQ